LNKLVQNYFSHLQSIYATVMMNFQNVIVIYFTRKRIDFKIIYFKDLPNTDPSKSEALSLLLCGATMRINKMKEIANSIFRIEGKLLSKETVSKGCMIIGNLLASKKKNFTIVDHISNDIHVIGSK
jgi:hypothetical protein